MWNSMSVYLHDDDDDDVHSLLFPLYKLSKCELTAGRDFAPKALACSLGVIHVLNVLLNIYIQYADRINSFMCKIAPGSC